MSYNCYSSSNKVKENNSLDEGNNNDDKNHKNLSNREKRKKGTGIGFLSIQLFLGHALSF